MSAPAIPKARPRDIVLAVRARRHGARYALRIILTARKYQLPASLLLAFVEQESGFRNVFGHDPSIYAGAGTVTRAKVAGYLRQRHATGKMQGVGTTQLTWFEFQDRAEQRGGLHLPAAQIDVAAEIIAGLVRQYGKTEGVRRYNGSGPAAVAYEQSVRARARRWHDILGAKP